MDRNRGFATRPGAGVAGSRDRRHDRHVRIAVSREGDATDRVCARPNTAGTEAGFDTGGR